MKELSIEQKAKAYDEAIERAKEWYSDAQIGIGFKANLEKLFPELKESEGEDIKQFLIDFIKVCGWTEKKDQGWPSKEKCIAWIEKQGEQKCTAEEVLIKAGLKPYKDGDQWCVLLGDNIQEGICGFGNTIEDALYAFLKDLIASQGEQKSVKVPKFKAGDFIQFNGMGNTRYTVKEVCGLSHYINTYNKRMDMSYTDANFELVEHSAWSEEDKVMLDEIIDFFENGTVKLQHDLSLYASWLKSLRPQKNNWERVTKEIYFKEPVLIRRKDKSDTWEGYRICNYYTLDLQTDECYIRIKDINNQKQWMPSEEQMVALDGICSYIRNKADWEISQDMVFDLYKLSEQLKKLREE